MPILTWNNPTECPGCGATIVVGIMSLSATCCYCDFYYADVPKWRGWYSSRAAYKRGDERIAGACIGGDPLCPCQDGDLCHYRGPNAWPIPKKEDKRAE